MAVLVITTLQNLTLPNLSLPDPFSIPFPNPAGGTYPSPARDNLIPVSNPDNLDVRWFFKNLPKFGKNEFGTAKVHLYPNDFKVLVFNFFIFRSFQTFEVIPGSKLSEKGGMKKEEIRRNWWTGMTIEKCYDWLGWVKQQILIRHSQPSFFHFIKLLFFKQELLFIQVSFL